MIKPCKPFLLMSYIVSRYIFILILVSNCKYIVDDKRFYTVWNKMVCYLWFVYRFVGAFLPVSFYSYFNMFDQKC